MKYEVLIEVDTSQNVLSHHLRGVYAILDIILNTSFVQMECVRDKLPDHFGEPNMIISQHYARDFYFFTGVRS